MTTEKLQRLYPPKDGWIIADLTMKTSELVDRQNIKNICAAGDPTGYEFPFMEQYGRFVTCVFRAPRKESEASA